MTANRLALIAKRLIRDRAQLQANEAEFCMDINTYLEANAVHATTFSGVLGISPSLLCDVRRGRRGLSPSMLAKLAGLR